MKIEQIRKRDGSLQPFTIDKVTAAVGKAFKETGAGGQAEAAQVAKKVHEKALALCVQANTATPDSPQAGKCADGIPAVEEVQDLVEQVLMEMDYFETAKAYILYRSKRREMRERDLFARRANLKPYEYPELTEYVDAIRHSYWIHTEFNYTSDVQDFKVHVSDVEREVIKKTMLAIAQIEVAVKTFWGNLYTKLPKPEIGAVGFTFAESEVRHMDAYAHLLEILGLNEEFKNLTQEPVIQERITYLERSIALSKTGDNREYMQSVLLFSLFIEHVSLFSQFLIMLSFYKHKNLFKGISNAVEATSKEEQIHGLFGIELINIIRKEHPEWFDKETDTLVQSMCHKAYLAEEKMVDWIFAAGELEFLSKDTVKEFIKSRLNNSLAAIGMTPVFMLNGAMVEETDWFDNEVIATKHVDFFQKRSINYNKRGASITAADLF